MAYIVSDADASLAMPAPPSGPQKTFLASDDGFLFPQAAAGNNFQGVKRNLMDLLSCEESAILLPVPSAKETVKVYLRVKPKTEEESHYYSMDSEDITSGAENEQQKEFGVVSLESDYQVAVHAPPDSTAYKNSVNGSGKLTHRYTFTKIFSPKTDQSGLFGEMVMPKLKDFLEGTNQLIFTYGATCSGKTFTIQGDSERPGILPRALDVLFNSVGDRQSSTVALKPLGFNRVAQLKPVELEKFTAEKRAIFELGKELKALNNSTESVTSNMSQESLATMFPFFRNRVRDSTVVKRADDKGLSYVIWVSFAEIYNENIYDLLEKMPEVKNKGDRPRRCPLKLAEDRGGCVYIRGLKEVPVNSADEAFQLLMIGRENLQFAATRLNHNSSRSHCIFTVKIVRVAADKEKPHCARVSMLSFCDLAGSERIKKTLTGMVGPGERQKEAGNINTSLLVLGRCIKAIRHNQTTKEAKRQQQIVPFRDSKLTRLFQSYFTGLGKASMIVNISQSPYLFDESLQVLKFAAIASRVNIELAKEPSIQEEDDEDKVECPPTVIKKKPKPVLNKRKTRFSILMDQKSHALTGRGSIAWENPSVRSTMCPMPSKETTVLEETIVETKYDGLLKIIDELKNQLIEEKQKNLKLEAEVRTELCEEFNKMMVEIEASWEQRLQMEKDRASELSEWRINKLEEAYKRKRKRQRENSDSDTESVAVEKMETDIKDKTKEIERLEEQVKAMKDMYKTVMEEKRKQQETITKVTFELADEKKKEQDVREDLAKLKCQLAATNQALEQQSAEPKIKELEEQVADHKKSLEEKQVQMEDLKTLLDEAGEEYLAKDHMISEKDKLIAKLQQREAENGVVCKDLETQVEELRALLTESTTRGDEKDLQIFELEEQVEKLTAITEHHEGTHTWLERKAVEQQLGNLNDEIENLKQEKKKLRGLADYRETELTTKDKEISNVEREIKSLLQADKQQQTKLEEMRAEVTMLRKQVKELTIKSSDNDRRLKEKQATVENLQVAVDATKQEGNAVDLLREELELKNKEKCELVYKVKKLQADAEAMEYDVKKTREERDKLMAHYEQQIKKKTEELAVEKREASKMRQVMHQSTPSKAAKNDQELMMLREEVEKKSELIKTLAAKVTTPKSKDSADYEEDYKQENLRLLKEVNSLKTAHSKELAKVKKAYEKIISQYKETNQEMQKHVVKQELPDEEQQQEELESTKASEKSTYVETPSSSTKKRTRGGRKKRQQATQVSFEDSNVENEPEQQTRAADVSDSDSRRKRPRRGTRVSRARPVRKTSAASVTKEVSFEVDSEDSSCAKSKMLLSDTSNRLGILTEDTCDTKDKTPANRKRKLFSNTPGAEVFTPPANAGESTASPHSIVKWQLRSRRSRKN